MLDAAGALASALRLLGDGCTPLSPPQSPATRAPVVLTKFIAEMCGSNPTHPAHAQVYRVQILSAVSVASGSMHMNVSDGVHCIEMQCPCASGQASRSAADSVMVADITIENSRVVDPPRTPLLISWFNDVSETMLNPYVQVGSPTSMVLVAASADGSAHGSAMSTRSDRGGGGVIAGVGGGGGGSGGNGDSDDDGSTATSDASDGALDVDNFDDEQCTGQCRYLLGKDLMRGGEVGIMSELSLSGDNVCNAVTYGLATHPPEALWPTYPFQSGWSLHALTTPVTGAEEDVRKSKIRSLFYHSVVRVQHGRGGKGNRYWIAGCCIWVVRRRFPDSRGLYTGHSWGSDGVDDDGSDSEAVEGSEYSDLSSVSWDATTVPTMYTGSDAASE